MKYKEKYEKAKGQYVPVKDTPQILHAKSVRALASEVNGNNFSLTLEHCSFFLSHQSFRASIYKRYSLHLQSKYKEASKKDMQSGSFTTLPETRDTAHSKEINKLVSGVTLPRGRTAHRLDVCHLRRLTTSLSPSLSLQKVYKAKFEKEKGKSIYNQMIVPPDVKHAMDVAKSQSNVSVAAVCRRVVSSAQFGSFSFLSQVSYKKDAKASLHYTTVADRPDIRKATQAARLISDVGGRLLHETQLDSNLYIGRSRDKFNQWDKRQSID